MGFFDFFRKKEVIIEHIDFSELETWLTTQNKVAEQKLQNSLAPLRGRINQEKATTKQNIVKLQEAQLRNNRIPQRAIDIMEGNRRTYAQKMEWFIDKIQIGNNYEEIGQFCDRFKEKIESLGKNTARSYQVLQEFFKDESYAIAGNIKGFEDIIKDVQQAIKVSKIAEISTLQASLQEIHTNKDRQRNLREDIERLQQEKKEISARKLQKEAEIAKMRVSPEYLNFLGLLKKREKILARQKAVENDLHQAFSTIEPGLKRYERSSMQEKLLRGYLTNPVLALIKDNDLQILSEIARLQNLLERDKIDLRGKKKETVAKGLLLITKEFVQNFIISRANVMQELSEIKAEIKKRDFKQELEELQNGLRRIEKLMQEKDQSRISAESELQEVNHSSLEKEINDKLDVNVKITSNHKPF
jgi:hypothetical protein